MIILKDIKSSHTSTIKIILKSGIYYLTLKGYLVYTIQKSTEEYYCVLTFEFLQSLIHTAQTVKELQGFICICFGNISPGKQVILDLRRIGTNQG